MEQNVFTSVVLECVGEKKGLTRMGNIQEVASRIHHRNQTGSLVNSEQLEHYTCMPSVDISEEKGTVILVTDVIGSTSEWKRDEEQMALSILSQNRIMRRILDAINQVYPSSLIKVNEIGDSWVVVSKGPNCASLAHVFAEMVIGASRFPLRIGAHYGDFAMVGVNRSDTNGFIPRQYQCFGLTDRVLQEVRMLEVSGENAVLHSSETFQERLETETGVLRTSQISVNVPLSRPLLPERINAYVLFIRVKSGRLDFFEEMCRWGRTKRTHPDFRVVSVENEGGTWNLIAFDLGLVTAWLASLVEALDPMCLKGSIAFSNKIWCTMDRTENPFETTVRYISHAQNIASRMLAHVTWGEFVSDSEPTTREIFPSHAIYVQQDANLKGLDATDLYSVRLNDASQATCLTPFACVF